MTKLLEAALSQLSKLSDQEQDQIAALIMEEIESDRKWDESFAASQDQLAKLADEALAEFERGDSRPCE